MRRGHNVQCGSASKRCVASLGHRVVAKLLELRHGAAVDRLDRAPAEARVEQLVVGEAQVLELLDDAPAAHAKYTRGKVRKSAHRRKRVPGNACGAL